MSCTLQNRMFRVYNYIFSLSLGAGIRLESQMTITLCYNTIACKLHDVVQFYSLHNLAFSFVLVHV